MKWYQEPLPSGVIASIFAALLLCGFIVLMRVVRHDHADHHAQTAIELDDLHKRVEKIEWQLQVK